ncbi:exopolysaccharide biosynthesis polyprenyl glycosylphosphotransferase [Paenibacillus sophorae]|uniref:Exopolysaccharide biosynthesis polyprenyl glycosylphosphotransferase n=1 Tax=Paenibacillus sophorae TaxID=1333845 RepID=A0A1H8QH56_9BACL|nr:sugar transferase [Paenibacillus sophorae]QWU15128.1 sugar transferase [Paenibacillus sophorae]SEO53366.1 exopolysaccharide biosynthesis polyprenyl glycosylphosphotransferase [Paenibacillus sophorae]
MIVKQIEKDCYDEYAVATDITYLPIRSKQLWFYRYVKALLDIPMSLMCLIITIPIMLVAIIAIKLESHGPVFYMQERVGLNGMIFRVFKLRSMRIDSEKHGVQWATKNDSRVTKVGSFIRKTRIDEIPQFINVLKGDMNLIGPRPERPMFTAQFNEEIPGFIQRLQVKPGITGWAQVNGGYDITPKEKLDLDLYYIQNSSFSLDMKILLKTIKVVFTGEGAR